MKNLLKISIMLVAICSLAFAQQNDENSNNNRRLQRENRQKDKNKVSMTAIYSELEALKTELIKPYFDKWKQEIDSKLSKEDLDKLVQLRAKAEELKSKAVAEMQEQRKQRQEERAEGKPNRKEMKKHFGVLRELKEELAPIVKTYEQLNDAILDDSDILIDKITDRVEEILAKFTDEESGKSMKMQKMRNMGFLNKLADERMVLGLTYLYNGNLEFGMGELNNQEIELDSYPNPFSNSSKIRFILKQAGNVKITLNDQNGNLVKVLADKEFPAGKTEIEVIATEYNLQPGLYFYSVEGIGIAKSGKMMLNK